MIKASEIYVKRVGRRLCAGSATKAKLLDGLRGEISQLDGEPGYDELVSAFGSPDEVAEELQCSVNEAEAVSARSKSRRIAIALGVVAAVLVVTLAAYVWYVSDSAEVYVVRGDIVTTTDYPSANTMFMRMIK